MKGWNLTITLKTLYYIFILVVIIVLNINVWVELLNRLPA